MMFRSSSVAKRFDRKYDVFPVLKSVNLSCFTLQLLFFCSLLGRLVFYQIIRVIESVLLVLVLTFLGRIF